ncbi:YhjD/YihY/BrkB family envelope integrity protein [Gordonia westfalica]|uniref:YhjD/YihY/BrkB family envelope integrity protein n=1 Tax=Gordonia westfalica TaxID=158898 RepID=A0ABU2GY03_9ACTN|nr:YhjD/YihY/BrkB family envelope integrity protein [Gordonia westfalica]MDS1116336.1 YhjD/YihY/BrkB family envelope integrity protein [Gordonia westfalica]
MRRPDLHAFAGRVLRLPGATLSLRILTDIARGDVTDRAMTLAAQAFTSILPIVILLLTLPGTDVVDDALTGLGIPVNRLDHTSVDDPQSFATFGVIGALMTIAGATSLSRALGRMYVSIWGVTKLPWRAFWRWVVVLFLIPAAVTAQGLSTGLQAESLFGIHLGGSGLLGIVLIFLVTVVIWSAVFTAIPRLLVSAQVPLRLLVLNGVGTGLLITVLLVGSRIALPALASSTIRYFGTLGIVFVAISWLFVFAAILVVTAIVVHCVATDAGRVGTWVRRWAGTPTPFTPTPSAAWYDRRD